MLATEERLKGTKHYGDFVYSEEEVAKYMKNEKWPKVDGWRQLSPGTGDEQVCITLYSHTFC